MGRLNSFATDSDNGKLLPGETRTITARDSSGETIWQVTLKRTTRPYVYDLCDAYNNRKNGGGRWRVDHVGNLVIAA